MNTYDNLDKPIIERIRMLLEQSKAYREALKTGQRGVHSRSFNAGLIAAYEVCIHHLELEEESCPRG